MTIGLTGEQVTQSHALRPSFMLLLCLGTAELWPYLLALNAVPALLVCVILPMLPESPRYLMITRGRRTQAEKGKQAPPPKK